MTIIVADCGGMAADTHSYRGDMREPCGFPKIVRNRHNGALGAATGCADDCWRFNRWFMDTQDIFGPQPEYSAKQDDLHGALVLMADGSLFVCWDGKGFAPVSSPCAIGHGKAIAFCRGAMAMGASIEHAVALAIRECLFAGGNVQFERVACDAACLFHPRIKREPALAA